MNKGKKTYLKFLQSDRKKFLVEIEKLSERAKNILENYDIETWDSFYYHLFINHDTGDFMIFRNCGVNTVKELITLMRNILNPNGRYNEELKKFESDFSQLISGARCVFRHLGISLFETFYYKFVIEKEVIDFKKARNCGSKTLPEVEAFVSYFCNYLGVKVPIRKPLIYFNPKNPNIPFVTNRKTSKTFSLELNNLSKSTRDQLKKMGATSVESFYLMFVSKDSQFNFIMGEFGEHNLSEILRLRTVLKDSIKEI